MLKQAELWLLERGEGLPRQRGAGLSGRGFCCFSRGFSPDSHAPAGHRSRSPVLDASLQEQDFTGGGVRWSPSFAVQGAGDA